MSEDEWEKLLFDFTCKFMTKRFDLINYEHRKQLAKYLEEYTNGKGPRGNDERRIGNS